MENTHIPIPQDVTIGGTVYTLSPLRLKELAELENFVRDGFIDSATANYNKIKSADADAAKKMLLDAVKEYESCRIGTTSFMRAINNLGTISEMVYLAARQKHPDLTKTKIEEIIQLRDIPGLAKVLTNLTGMVDTDAPFPEKTEPLKLQ